MYITYCETIYFFVKGNRLQDRLMKAITIFRILVIQADANAFRILSSFTYLEIETPLYCIRRQIII